MSTSSVTAATTTPPATTAVPTTTGSSKIDGLTSGLNTTAIISAIMAQAALPQTHMKSQLAIETAKLAAYQSINTKMATLQTAAAALSSGATWQLMTTTSSSSSVAASAGPGALASSFSFDVTHLATAQSSAFSTTIVGLSATVVSSGTSVTITGTSGSPVTINTGDGSLAALVAGINASKSGVQAAAIQTSPGKYRLQLSSATTGLASKFSTTGLDAALGTMANTTDALDAEVTVGSGTNSYKISSSSNTFSEALPGVTFTVSQLTTGVTLSTAANSGGIADEVQAMVDAANAVLTEISTDTAFNTTTVTGSVLTGDFTARSLQGKILNSIGSALGNGTSAMSVGLNVTKDGAVTFDRAAFQAAYAANPDAVESAFVASGTFAPAQVGLTGSISLQKSSDATIAGAYLVKITQAATKANSTIDISNMVLGDTIEFGSGSSASTYTAVGGESAQTVIDALNVLSSTNQLNVNATLDTATGKINLESTGYGAEYTFAAPTVTGALIASPVTAGLDVAGTINSQHTQGIGQFLFTNAGTPGIDAMSLFVTLTSADVVSLSGSDAGTLSYAAGASQKLASVANAASATRTGTLSSEIDGENATLASLNTQIAAWQIVLDTKQSALQRTWATLETTLSNIKAQSSALTAAINSLTNSTSSTSSGG